MVWNFWTLERYLVMACRKAQRPKNLLNLWTYGTILNMAVPESTRPLEWTLGTCGIPELLIMTYGWFGFYMHLLLSLLMHILDNKVLLSFADGLLFLVYYKLIRAGDREWWAWGAQVMLGVLLGVLAWSPWCLGVLVVLWTLLKLIKFQVVKDVSRLKLFWILSRFNKVVWF